MDNSRICIVIPAFNEDRAIGPVLDEAKGLGLDVLVVDDGSTDETAGIARATTGIHLVVHERNQGKGVAIRTAISWLLERKYDAALFMDADGQHLPAEAPLFARKFEETGADLIVGSRMAELSSMPRIRRLSNRFSSLLISALAGTTVTDSQSGYRLLSATLLRRLQNMGGQGFDFESEMIIDAVREGMKYEEVPISCIYGEERSHYHPVRDSLQFFALVARKTFQLLTRKNV